ncbi:MAG TPA: DUF5668 domain-containing protein [Terriglobales bacterium]|nr:DUF5668 domain-containing protein [Terriglobales bacterium]
MQDYMRNPNCGCVRCRSCHLMGPAILITLGVLMLLSEYSHISFGYTWPIILIVIGLVRVFQSNAPMDGHVSRYLPVNPPAPPGPPQGQGSNSGQVQNV